MPDALGLTPSQTAGPYLSIGLLRDLVPVLDHLDRALTAARGAGGASNVVEGVELIQREMLRVLERAEQAILLVLQLGAEPLDLALGAGRGVGFGGGARRLTIVHVLEL